MRKCLICGSPEVVTPLLGMFALALCETHRLVVSEAHREAKDEAEDAGQPHPMLTEEFARAACCDHHFTPQHDSRPVDGLAVSGVLLAANEAMVLAQLQGGNLDVIREAVRSSPYWPRFCELAKSKPIHATLPVEKMVIGWAQSEGARD